MTVAQVRDLGAVLHMVGGTAASFMIFFLPGMLLINAAIVKATVEQADEDEEVSPSTVCIGNGDCICTFAGRQVGIRSETHPVSLLSTPGTGH